MNVQCLPDSVLKQLEAQNCQANNDAGASSVAERDDNQRRRDNEVSVNPFCPSQEETVVDPCRSEVVRTSSTEDVNASIEQTPSTPVCADGDRNSAVIHGPVKSVDPDNSEDGIYRVFSTCPCLCAHQYNLYGQVCILICTSLATMHYCTCEAGINVLILIHWVLGASSYYLFLPPSVYCSLLQTPPSPLHVRGEERASN